MVSSIRPWGIAVDAEGEVYVADTYNYLNPGLHKRRRIGSDASGARRERVSGQFVHREFLCADSPGPAGIAIPANNEAVTDRGNFRVQVILRALGAFSREWGLVASPGPAWLYACRDCPPANASAT